ncbi:MAG: DOMON-like domain-containing protein [Synechococcaceae cyanobacterium]|nr:DOMON-like domain-containing protein [Synechococcaceae cyanobacterium]
MALSSHRFRLRPFAAEGIPDGLSLTGRFRRLPDGLEVHYALTGAPGSVQVPAPAPAPSRRDGLWQSTCLEFFLARPDQEAYLEINLSPSGDWNAYRLTGYRAGLEPESTITLLRPRVRRSAQRLTLDVHCPLPAGLGPAGPLEVAVCAVLELEGGRLTYWALHHPGPQPDFHDRAGFHLRLPPLETRGSATVEGPGV